MPDEPQKMTTHEAALRTLLSRARQRADNMESLYVDASTALKGFVGTAIAQDLDTALSGLPPELVAEACAMQGIDPPAPKTGPDDDGA